MFLAALFIAIGLAILLNTLGFMTGAFWGFFWAIFFIVVGLRMMMKKGCCPECSWGMMGSKFHGKMHGECCGHDHEGHNH